MKLKALFLDMDHTLCDTERADVEGAKALGEKLHKHCKAHADACQNLARHYLQLLYKNPDELPRDASEDENEYRSRLLQFAAQKTFPIAISMELCRQLVQELMDDRMKHFDFFEGTAQKLAQWRQQFRLIVISNGPLYSQQPKAARVQLEDHVDRVVLAGDHPWQKPDPRLFQWVLNQEELSKDEVMHVGDSLASDIAGAQAAGIYSVWINPSERQGPQEPKAKAEIPHINELDAVIASWESA